MGLFDSFVEANTVVVVASRSEAASKALPTPDRRRREATESSRIKSRPKNDCGDVTMNPSKTPDGSTLTRHCRCATATSTSFRKGSDVSPGMSASQESVPSRSFSTAGRITCLL